tara:strand:- start:1287 stop:1730 length:444 start_codon:yes stop_codon:yes gene_type:complete
MRSNKRKVITNEVNKVYYGTFSNSKLKESFNYEMTEEAFLNSFRLLKTYEERKDQLEKRGYYLVGDDWENEQGDDILTGNPIMFYYNTFTINKVGKVEKWVKRKPYKKIKNQLLSLSHIKDYNPVTSFNVKDDEGNEITFFSIQSKK